MQNHQLLINYRTLKTHKQKLKETKEKGNIITLGMTGFSASPWKWASAVGLGRTASVIMRKLGTSSDVWVPRTSLWRRKEESVGWGNGEERGTQWTVRDGHSRGWEMTRSYRNCVFFFHTENSSFNCSGVSSCSSSAAIESQEQIRGKWKLGMKLMWYMPYAGLSGARLRGF